MSIKSANMDIIVPALGESVAEATVKWLKKQGDPIKVDEAILELETEKVTLEVNAPAEGILSSVLKKDGETVFVGEVVGHIGEGNGQVKTAVSSSTGTEKVFLEAKKIDPSTTMPPAVQKIVNENNLNPSLIAGSGKDGRLTKGDALAAISNTHLSASSNSQISGDKPVERIKMSRLRKTIAQRLKDSQNTAAILTTFNEIDMTNIVNLRQKYREEFEKKHGIKLGFMSFFVKATVEALKAIPSVNAEIDNDDIVYKNYYDIGVAVGTEQGLVVPVVKGSDKLTFSGIETEISNFGKKAREGKLTMADLSGGTFTISNGGVYGSLLSTPIINPPQSGILGLHKTQERPVAINGKIEIRQMMYVALSYDHRIIDGKEAVTFLVKVKDAIENPERLLLNI